MPACSGVSATCALRKIHSNEDLTKTRAKVAADARKLKRDKRIDDTWVRDGTVFLSKRAQVRTESKLSVSYK